MGARLLFARCEAASGKLVVGTYIMNDENQKSGPAALELQDITQPRHRIIYGDEPTPRKP